MTGVQTCALPIFNRHQEYLAKGDDERHRASQILFEKSGLLSLLGESEKHSLISHACKKLFSVHQAFDNFYNEPPFAERLLELTSQVAMPSTAKSEMVEVVVTCAVGNPYGVSKVALSYYEEIVKNFSPEEISIMLRLPKSNTIVGKRIGVYKHCRDNFIELVKLIDEESVPTRIKTVYERWKR